MNLFSCVEPYNDIPLECSSDKYKTTLILRILSGSIDLKNNLTQETVKLDNCYIDSLSRYKTRIQRAKKIFKSFDSAVSLNDYKSFVNDFQFKNISFFSKILEEIESFSWFTLKRHHTSAFIYIYRILEHISVSFPLIYVSSTKDFSSSFGLLKSYFNRETDYNSELKFFNGFLKLAFGKNTCLEQSYKIAFYGDDVVREAFFKVFKISYLHEYVINEDENSFVEIKWGDIGAVIISIRNHFFHFDNSGRRNLSPSDLVDPELFFEIVNSVFIRWLSSVLIEVCNPFFPPSTTV